MTQENLIEMVNQYHLNQATQIYIERNMRKFESLPPQYTAYNEMGHHLALLTAYHTLFWLCHCTFDAPSENMQCNI